MPEKTPWELVQEIERGEIEVPELQREFVWSDEQVKQLAESLYKGYPIGLIILYRLPQGLRTNPNTHWVLDGQQRLLSLCLIIKGKVKLRVFEKNLFIWFNPKTEEFRAIANPEQKFEGWVKIVDLASLSDFLELAQFLQGFSPQEQQRLTSFWLNLRQSQIPVHTIRGENIEDDIDKLGEIFVRINFAGTRVRGTDVYSTMLAVTEPGTVQRLRQFVDGNLNIDPIVGDTIDYSIAIRTFTAFLTDGRVKLASRVLEQAEELKRQLEKLRGEIPRVLDQTEKNLKEAVKLLTESPELQLVLRDSDYFPSQNTLVTLAFYIGKRRTLQEEERKGLLGWYILASILGRYTSASETRLNEDLSAIAEGGDYQRLLDNLERREGNLKERLKELIDAGQSNKLLLYALLRMRKAKDLHPLPAQRIGLTAAAHLTVHHIFPRSQLSHTQYESEMNDIGNLTFVTMGAQHELSNRLPEDYLKEFSDEERRAHFIPNDTELWRLGDFPAFLQHRKELLKEGVEEFWQAFNLG
jgi:hypothetical protein